MTFGLHFGVLADSFEKQIKNQGLTYSRKEIKKYQELYDKVLNLVFACLITDKQHEIIRKKLYKRIEQHVVKVNKLKIQK